MEGWVFFGIDDWWNRDFQTNSKLYISTKKLAAPVSICRPAHRMRTPSWVKTFLPNILPSSTIRAFISKELLSCALILQMLWILIANEPSSISNKNTNFHFFLNKAYFWLSTFTTETTGTARAWSFIALLLLPSTFFWSSELTTKLHRAWKQYFKTISATELTNQF